MKKYWKTFKAIVRALWHGAWWLHQITEVYDKDGKLAMLSCTKCRIIFYP